MIGDCGSKTKNTLGTWAYNHPSSAAPADLNPSLIEIVYDVHVENSNERPVHRHLLLYRQAALWTRLIPSDYLDTVLENADIQ